MESIVAASSHSFQVKISNERKEENFTTIYRKQIVHPAICVQFLFSVLMANAKNTQTTKNQQFCI